MVLHNQVVTLKLPVGVTVFLYFGEGVAADIKYIYSTTWSTISPVSNLFNQ